MEKIFEIAADVSTPLALAGVIAVAFFLILQTLLKSGLLSSLSPHASGDILQKLINRLFQLAVLATFLGFFGFAVEKLGSAKTDKFDSILHSDKFGNILLGSLQELKQSRIFLCSLSKLKYEIIDEFPVGKVRTEKTLQLVSNYYDKISQYSYGEENRIFQLSIEFRDLGEKINQLKTKEDVRFFSNEQLSIDDVRFLAGFLEWYFSVHAETNLSYLEQRSLHSFQVRGFESCIPQENLTLKKFNFDIPFALSYEIYLGLID